MDAVTFNSYGPPEVLELRDKTLPTPGKGMVRIKVVAAGVNPADIKWRAGMFRETVPVSMPHVLGYDVAGTVDLLGDGVTNLAVGDRVCAMLDPVVKGGYATFAVTDADNIALVPDGMDLDMAATLPTPGLAGVQLIRDHVRPRPGEVVLVTGATGAVGRFAMQAVIELGARVVAAVREDQQDTAMAFGASQAFVLGEDPPLGLHLDHIADVIGGEVVALLCRRLDPVGRIMTLATTPIDPAGLPTSPVFVAVRPCGSMLSEVCEMVLGGKVSPMQITRLPLSCATQAHRTLERGGANGRIILQPC